jgi:hypothetical protein
MKVIYEYDEQSTQLLANVDRAIKIYLEELEKQIRKSTFHINVNNRYLNECIRDDPKYQQLLDVKRRILNLAIPKVIIIESDDSVFKVSLNEKQN